MLVPDGEIGASLGDDDGSTCYVINPHPHVARADRHGGVA